MWSTTAAATELALERNFAHPVSAIYKMNRNVDGQKPFSWQLSVNVREREQQTFILFAW